MLPMSDYEAVKNATVNFWQNANDPKANVMVGLTSTQNEVGHICAGIFNRVYLFICRPSSKWISSTTVLQHRQSYSATS